MENGMEMKIDLMRLNGAFVQEFRYQDGITRPCVCIPIEQAMLFKGKADANGVEPVYLEASVYSMDKPNQFGYTHRLRQVVSSQYYKAIPADRRKDVIPYIGSARPPRNAKQDAGQAARPVQARPNPLAPPPGCNF